MEEKSTAVCRKSGKKVEADVRTMKIGILTFHCAHNYGAVLQCYALQEMLKGMGHTVEIIDYRPDYLRMPFDVINLHRIQSRNLLRLVKSIILETLSLSQRIIRHRKFDSFIKYYLNLSRSVGISSDYDVYVMGSDQIWNPKITNGFDGVYFGYLPFPKAKNRSGRFRDRKQARRALPPPFR